MTIARIQIEFKLELFCVRFEKKKDLCAKYAQSAQQRHQKEVNWRHSDVLNNVRRFA